MNCGRGLRFRVLSRFRRTRRGKPGKRGRDPPKFASSDDTVIVDMEVSESSDTEVTSTPKHREKRRKIAGKESASDQRNREISVVDLFDVMSLTQIAAKVCRELKRIEEASQPVYELGQQ